MYIKHLEVRGLKLLRDFSMSFEREGGRPRMWTVLLGENGTCKTTILQAIAAAASGYVRANQLADVPSLPDRRSPDHDVKVRAQFSFSGLLHQKRNYPGLAPTPEPPTLQSSLSIAAGHSIFRGSSFYSEYPPTEGGPANDPLEDARAKNTPLWFVAGYGTSRMLPRPMASERTEDAIISRLNPLFDKGRIIGTGFADILENPQEFSSTLRGAFVDQALLPKVTGVELRGRGGVKSATDLVEGHRFGMQFGKSEMKLPATWLSQGYQCTIAWIADLVGQVFLEAGGAVPLDEMQGLVLIDELDLHLHPQWQVEFVGALKRIFPLFQFVVTTHSPMVLPGLDRDEVYLLGHDELGDVVATSAPESPALMTGSQIYRHFFGINSLYPRDLGRSLRRLSFLVGNPLRTDEEQDEMARLRAKLSNAGIDPEWEPVSRVRQDESTASASDRSDDQD